MEKHLRKLIKEELHAILQLEEISKNAAEKVWKQIVLRKDDIKDDLRDFKILSDELYDLDFSNGVFINDLNIFIYLYRNKKEFENNKVGGGIDSEAIKQVTVDGKTMYNGEVKIKIYNWNYEFDLRDEIRKVFEHELHHIFNEAILINKKNTTKALNKSRNNTRGFLKNLLDKYYQLKEFDNVFYLNLPNERNARIHQLHLEALKLKGKTADEIIKELEKFTPYKDFQKMLNFQFDVKFDNIPYEAKKEYVDMFLKELEFYKKKNGFTEEELKYPTDPDKFFNFWAKIFRKNATILFKYTLNIANKISPMEHIDEQRAWYDTGLSSESIDILFGIENEICEYWSN